MMARIKQSQVGYLFGHSVREPKRTKYRARRTEYDGVVYASQAEADRARALDAMKVRGEVAWWIGQPVFRLGVAENKYVADYLVISTDGSIHAEDVKGVRTPKFQRDVKLWARFGPCDLWVIGSHGIEIIESQCRGGGSREPQEQD